MKGRHGENMKEGSQQNATHLKNKQVKILSSREKSDCFLGLTLALEFFFLEAGLLAPLPLLKPIFSSDKTRCCSSSDNDCRFIWKRKKMISLVKM